MTFPSVDQLQNELRQSVFHYAQDSKKAAGRALGTLVEVFTFYLFKSWGLEAHIAIERPLPEYPDGDISHNVEYSLHPSKLVSMLTFGPADLPLTSSKVLRALERKDETVSHGDARKHSLLSANRVLLTLARSPTQGMNSWSPRWRNTDRNG
jgi:hypothetical protein